MSLVTRGRALARAQVAKAVPKVAARVGLDVLPRSYYSPIPDLTSLDAGFWDQPTDAAGVDLGIERGFAFLEEHLAPQLADWAPPDQPQPGRLFHLKNITYETPDPQTLYAMVRHLRPKRLVELGSGASSAVLLEALEGLPTAYQIFDPYPRDNWMPILSQHAEVQRIPAERVPMSVFTDLSADDVLFIDTSHTVRAGGDVCHLFLEVLPRLQPGVVVHVHDIFLPHPYPQQWFQVQRRYFAEQFLLQAFLAHNSDWEVILPVHAMVRADLSRFQASVPGTERARGGAFWMRRTH